MSGMSNTIASVLDKYKISMSAERIGKRTDITEDGWSKAARHWRCVFKREAAGYSSYFETEFSQGSACTKPPTAEEVMDCLLSDCDALDYEFEEWASNLGFSPDSRKAESTYKFCRYVGEKLRAFIGSEAFDALRNCERL